MSLLHNTVLKYQLIKIATLTEKKKKKKTDAASMVFFVSGRDLTHKYHHPLPKLCLSINFFVVAKDDGFSQEL